jgi:phosphopantetheinyl transferase
MTCHAFLVGEVINELYLQTKHFFISQHLKNLYILLYDQTTNCGLDVQIRFLIFTTWILHTSVPEYIDQKDLIMPQNKFSYGRACMWTLKGVGLLKCTGTITELENRPTVIASRIT